MRHGRPLDSTVFGGLPDVPGRRHHRTGSSSRTGISRRAEASRAVLILGTGIHLLYVAGTLSSAPTGPPGSDPSNGPRRSEPGDYTCLGISAMLLGCILPGQRHPGRHHRHALLRRHGGRWYSTAWSAVEVASGVIVLLAKFERAGHHGAPGSRVARTGLSSEGRSVSSLRVSSWLAWLMRHRRLSASCAATTSSSRWCVSPYHAVGHLCAVAVVWATSGAPLPPIFSEPASKPTLHVVDPFVQAMTLTDIVVSATVTSMLLALAIQIHKRARQRSIPDELNELRG